MDELRSAELVPNYDGLGVANLPAFICRAFGAPIEGLRPPLPSTAVDLSLFDQPQSVVLFVADGLGLAQLELALAAGRMPHLAGLLGTAGGGDGQASLSALRTVFPSSTVPALATLFSGLPPSEHALLGWTLYAEELGGAIEVARWRPAGHRGGFADPERGGPSPETFFGCQTLANRLAAVGVACHVVGMRAYQGSPFTRMVHQGARYHPYAHLAGAAEVLHELVAESGGRPTFVCLYWPGIDQASHEYGPGSDQADACIETLDQFLGTWAGHRQLGRSLFLLTADHGQVSTPPAEAIVLNARPELEQHLAAPLVGERRGLFAFARPGHKEAARAYLTEVLDQAASVLDVDEVLAGGLLGPPPPSPTARRRAGDLLLLAHGSHQLIYSHDCPPRPKPMAGNHGGLDRREMEVPLLTWRS